LVGKVAQWLRSTLVLRIVADYHKALCTNSLA
jgi:hypothetical protein